MTTELNLNDGPVINIDLDDTVMNFSRYTREYWLPFHWGIRPQTEVPCDYSFSDWIPEKDLRRFFHEFSDSRSYRSIPLVDQRIPDYIASWRQEGARVRVVTARGARTPRDEAEAERVLIEQADTMYSLAEQGIEVDEVIFDSNKSKYPATLAMEDHEVTSHEYLAAKIPLVVMDRPWNVSVPAVHRFGHHEWEHVNTLALNYLRSIGLAK